MEKMVDIKFKRWNCRLEKGVYNNGRIALELVNVINDEPVLVATINIPEIHIETDEVVIKNYSENQGVLDVMVKAKIISEPIRYITTGHTSSPICKLLLAS